jgi:hypothetical protein
MYGDFQSHVASQLEAIQTAGTFKRQGGQGLERFAKTRSFPLVRHRLPGPVIVNMGLRT